MNNSRDIVNIYSSSYYEGYQNLRQCQNCDHPTIIGSSILNLHNFVQNFDAGLPTNGHERAGKTIRPKNWNKPPFSYVSMIVMALESSPDRRCTLGGIYDYLKSRFEFFHGPYQGWKNSIRHNLSLNDCFIKLPKNDDISSKSCGKGHFWTLSPDYGLMFENSTLKRRRRGYKNRRSFSDKILLANVNETPYDFLAENNQLYERNSAISVTSVEHQRYYSGRDDSAVKQEWSPLAQLPASQIYPL